MAYLHTFWLNVANITLGAATVVFLFSVLAACIHELLSRRKKRRAVFTELNSDVRSLFLHKVAPFGAGAGDYRP